MAAIYVMILPIILCASSKQCLPLPFRNCLILVVCTVVFTKARHSLCSGKLWPVHLKFCGTVGGEKCNQPFVSFGLCFQNWYPETCNLHLPVPLFFFWQIFGHLYSCNFHSWQIIKVYIQSLFEMNKLKTIPDQGIVYFFK